MFVPVTSQTGGKLMPTRPNKAGMLIKKGLATPYWSNGIFCIRLNYDTTHHKQDIVVGVDPGSKKEGFTVKSESHTYLNVQADAHDKERSETFGAHCVDSWCLAHHAVGGKYMPDNTAIFCIAPIPIKRRCLHREQEAKGRKRNRYGGTRCLNTVKNALVKHIKHGLLRVSGHQNGKLTLSEINSSKQVVLQAKENEYTILKRLNFKYKDATTSQT